MANLTPAEFRSRVATLPANIDKILLFASQTNCSDVFIEVGKPATLYRFGILYQTTTKISDLEWHQFTDKAISSELNTEYVRSKMLDFSYSLKGYRYRVNCSFSSGNNIATFRMISSKLPTFQSLSIPQELQVLLKKAFEQPSSISLISSATGSGKSSTLAACINTFSATNDKKDEKKPLRDAHLITLEDPIEYIFPTRSATLIQQKELRKDFMSYELGIVSSLREHPTHILLGEIRDTNTIKAAIEASRTGHNVFTTFHTSNVADTITRLYDNIQSSDNAGLIFDLIANLNFILCQRLLKGRSGYTFDYQHLFFTEQVKKVIFKALYENQNISDVIERLVKNPQLQKATLSSDWKIKR